MKMWNSFYEWVGRNATWPVIALLFILCFACTLGFEWRKEKLGYANKPLDGRSKLYSPENARALFDSIGPDGRNLYAITEVSLDLVFPFAYGLLLAVLLFHLYSSEAGKYIIALPVLAAVSDVFENVTIAYLAWSFDGQASAIARVAVVFYSANAILLILSLVAVLVGAVLSLRKAKTLAASQ
jgi:hypothetical protein